MKERWKKERERETDKGRKKVTFGKILQRGNKMGEKRSLISPDWILLALDALLMKYGCGTIFKVNAGWAAAGRSGRADKEKPHAISSLPVEDLHRQFAQWGASSYVSTPTARCCRAACNSARHRNGPHFSPSLPGNDSTSAHVCGPEAKSLPSCQEC